MRTNNFQIIKANKILSDTEQWNVRNSLKYLLEIKGFISMCLDNEYLYVEYHPDSHSPDSLKLLLMEAGFPLGPTVERTSKKEGFKYADLQIQKV